MISRFLSRMVARWRGHPTPHQIAYGEWREARTAVAATKARYDDALRRRDDRDIGRALKSFTAARRAQFVAENKLFMAEPIPGRAYVAAKAGRAA